MKRKVSTHTSKLGQMYAFIPSLGVIAKTDRAISSMDIPEEALLGMKNSIVEERKQKGSGWVPRLIHIIPTGKCQGGCPYCYAQEEWKDVEFMDLEMLSAALDANIEDDSVVEVLNVYGGEPLIDARKCIKIFEYLFDRFPNATVGMSTGLMIDESEFGYFMNWLAFDAPESFDFSVSIDPMDNGKKYMRRRWGNDTYNILHERLDMIMEHRDVCVKTVLTMNGSNPFPMIRELTERYKKPVQFSVDLEDSDRFNMTDDQFSELLSDMRLYVKENLVDTGVLGSNDTGDHYRKSFPPFSKVFTEGEFAPRGLSCNAATGVLTINTDGGVSGCSRVMELGRGHDYKEMLEHDIERYLDPTGLPCDTCEYFASCGGGCAEALRQFWKEGVPMSCNWRMDVIDLSAEMLITEGHQDMIDIARYNKLGLSQFVEKMIASR